ncbi:hypothetical protein OROMI_012836 [Orobanche minor]
MENPFFRNGRWYQQPPRRPFSQSSSFGSEPIYQFDPAVETRRCPAEISPGAKVIRIPVHFVGSGQADRSACALKIQKVFRGFLVRRCLRKINDIKVQVDEIEERLSRSDVAELVRRDEKERLRMNESLMSLLFKLDSICGVDFGVRGCRKAVIRKAISLQEKIDAIVAIDLEAESGGIEIDDDTNQANVHVRRKDSSTVNAGTLKNYVEFGHNGNRYEMEVEGNDEEVDVIDVGVDREVRVINEEKNCVGGGGSVYEKSNLGRNENDDDERNLGLLERMVEDNGKMMSLITQLFERNEMQTRMINTLTHRLEMLEKAFVCDGKLRRRVKKKLGMKKNVAASCRED